METDAATAALHQRRIQHFVKGQILSLFDLPSRIPFHSILFPTFSPSFQPLMHSISLCSPFLPDDGAPRYNYPRNIFET